MLRPKLVLPRENITVPVNLSFIDCYNQNRTALAIIPAKWYNRSTVKGVETRY